MCPDIKEMTGLFDQVVAIHLTLKQNFKRFACLFFIHLHALCLPLPFENFILINFIPELNFPDNFGGGK